MISSARGGRKQAEGGELLIEIVRSLTSEDLPALSSPTPVGSIAPTVQALRASHHQLAQLLAVGTADGDAALITGYSISRISILKADPTFQQLLAHYDTQRELKFAEVMDRMRVLGLSTLDEIQARLEETPGGFSNRELMELAELMLVKGRQFGGGPASGGTAPVSVNVTFVDAASRQSGPIIQGEAVES